MDGVPRGCPLRLTFADGKDLERLVQELSQEDVLTALHSVLQEQCSEEFHRRWHDHQETWEGADPGPYIVAALYSHVFVDAVKEMLQRTVASEAKLADSVLRVLAVVEDLMQTGSREARGLVVVGFLEGVQNIALNRGLDPTGIEPHLGQRTRRGWAWLNRIWSDKSTLADVVRADVRGELEEPDW